MDLADSRAYDAAIECAALCMIALGSPGNDEFRQHMREALSEALHLRGAFDDSERLVDKFEVRNVLKDILTDAMTIFSGELTPCLSTNISAEIGKNADMTFGEGLRAALTRIEEMYPSEH